MKNLLFTCLFLSGFCHAVGQDINLYASKPLAESTLGFLASDELKGRDTGSPELDIAAKYIAQQFKLYGLKPVAGAENYMQEFYLAKEYLPEVASLTSGNLKKEIANKDLIVIKGKKVELNAPAVFVGYGTDSALDAASIEGKIVVSLHGYEGDQGRQAFMSSRMKRASVSEKGGAALVELYSQRGIPWPALFGYFSNSRFYIDEGQEEEKSIPALLLRDFENEIQAHFNTDKEHDVAINIISKKDEVKVKNVVAVLEGTDKKLKNEYLALSAHYDHVGVASGILKEDDNSDTIYNGARDNAIGTTGLILAAKYFSEHPPKRSIVFIGFTAEEKGLLGSQWYTANPLIPLDQTIYNLNIDCAGYNDTTKITVFNLEKTTADEHFFQAAEEVGLTVNNDPVPEQNIYRRSDHYNFAEKGVPAVLYGPGVVSFDEEITKYYHQVTDEVETLNFDYLQKLYYSFIRSAELIGNEKKPPFWAEGDELESKGKELYGTK